MTTDPAMPTEPTDQPITHHTGSKAFILENAALRASIAELEHELREAREENAKEYLRGRKDEQDSRMILAPTWRGDVVPLRQQIAERAEEIAGLRELLKTPCCSIGNPHRTDAEINAALERRKGEG